MNRRAETFVMTDGRLAERTGLGLDQAQRARDLICAPGVGLFEKSVRGVPPRSNYKADYVRLYDWLIQRLSAMGMASVTRLIPALQNMQAAQQNGEPNLGETGKLICRKPPNQFAEKRENNQEELNKKNKYSVPPRTKRGETKNFANPDLGGGGGNQMMFDLMLSEPEQALVNVLNELGMRTTKTTIGIAQRFAASGIEISALSERIRAEHAEISTANVGDVIAVLVTRLRYADPAKWLAAPKAAKGKGSRRGGMRYRQVDYTDEQRREAQQRASEKLSQQSPEEKVRLLQRRIDMAQRQLIHNPNDADAQRFINQAQHDLLALTLTTA